MTQRGLGRARREREWFLGLRIAAIEVLHFLPSRRRFFLRSADGERSDSDVPHVGACPRHGRHGRTVIFWYARYVSAVSVREKS